MADRLERSARLRWVGGEFRLKIEVPAAFAPPPEDASPYVPVALVLSMYRGEDLQVDGAVSPRLLRATEQIQACFAAWDPGARRCRVRATAELERAEPAGAIGCMMSRGVDSLHAATRPREQPLTQLVFCDSLEPIWDESVRARERELTREAAARIGLPLAVVSTNLRDPAAQLVDYNDLHGAGLALIALSLSGGLGRCVVPSGGTLAGLHAAGSHPLLDPLFSTEAIEIEHASPWEDRTQRIRDLAAERPDLLDLIKPCNAANTAGNCGRCKKCLRTMIGLRVAGVVDRVPSLPAEIDPALIRELRLNDILLRHFWLQSALALGDGDAELRDAVMYMLRRSARPSLRERLSLGPRRSSGPSRLGRAETDVCLGLLVDGRPEPHGLEAGPPQPKPAWEVGPLQSDWAPPPAPAPGLAGLVRLIDPESRRHHYAVGQVPPLAGVERVGELGALLTEPAEGSGPAWVTADGRLVTEGYDAVPAEPTAEALGRWVLGPARWRGVAPSRAHAVEIVRRGRAALEAIAVKGRSPAASSRGAQAEHWSAEHRRPGTPIGGPPAGWLASQAGEGRLPLFSSIHPVTGDQLLSTDRGEAQRLGYGEPSLLGHLEAQAPMSGRLGTGRPFVPWASRFGQA